MAYERFESLRDSHAAEVGTQLILHALVRALRPAVAVETGTHRGMSACYIAEALKENDFGHLFTYDIKDYGQEKNIAKFDLQNYVTCKIRDSKSINENCIDFVFIDADHSEEFVLEEWGIIKKRLSQNAVVVWDNASLGNENVWKFGVRKLMEKEKMTYLPVINGMLIYYNGDTKLDDFQMR